MTTSLVAAHMNKAFGDLVVTDTVSLEIKTGERVALIGPNGAGKTTLVNLLSGALKTDSGGIWLFDKEITALNQQARVKAGLVRTFQITTLAQELTVGEQIRLAIFERTGLARHFWRSAVGFEEVENEASQIADLIGINSFVNEPVENLAYGVQRLVEIAIALALQPKVLLLDEPMAGVPREDEGRLITALDSLPDELSVLIIEHDMDLVFKMATRIIVMAEGRVIANDTPERIQNNSRVREVYLG